MPEKKTFEVEFRVTFDTETESAAFYDRLQKLAEKTFSRTPGAYLLRVNVWQCGVPKKEVVIFTKG
jgi:hypothetical protein